MTFTYTCTCVVTITPEDLHLERRAQTLDYENPGLNPGCGVKTLGKFFQSTLLQFIQLNK